MTTDSHSIIGVLEETVVTDGTQKDGTTRWRRFAFKIRTPTGIGTYSTFDKGWPTNLTTGTTYRFTYTEKQGDRGMLRDLTGAVEVPPDTFGAQPAGPPTETVPTDEAKAEIAINPASPQPELKSPSRSFDQNQDIQRRSIERQGALKAAVEVAVASGDGMLGDAAHTEVAITGVADIFFAWLREESDTDVKAPPSKPTEFDSGPGPTNAPETGFSGIFPLHEEEDDQPGPVYGADGEPQRQFATAGELRTALSGDFGLTTKKQCDDAFGGDINLADRGQVYATIKAHKEAKQ